MIIFSIIYQYLKILPKATKFFRPSFLAVLYFMPGYSVFADLQIGSP
uniref:Uncharacterized protein n=1 Tax=Arundo donax TaxID=35708 RepID=A0A0A9CK73_ARUDO